MFCVLYTRITTGQVYGCMDERIGWGLSHQNCDVTTEPALRPQAIKSILSGEPKNNGYSWGYML